MSSETGLANTTLSSSFELRPPKSEAILLGGTSAVATAGSGRVPSNFTQRNPLVGLRSNGDNSSPVLKKRYSGAPQDPPRRYRLPGAPFQIHSLTFPAMSNVP